MQKPATWSSASASETLKAVVPITIAISTSQSDFSDPSGMTTSSVGPEMEEGALLKTTGSLGMGMLDSCA
ncbi:hypothetical protein D3C71_1895720 [compost metagenome]